MKKKILGAFLTVALFSSILGGCGRDTPSDSQVSTISEISEITESLETSATTQTAVDDITEPITEAQSDFDFVKTVESTYICGQKLSYPITWGQFGEDFSIEYESAFVNSEKQFVSAFVEYKGYDVGMFGFTGCDSVDAINADTTVSSISVLSNDMDFFGTSKITVSDLSLVIDHSQLFDTFGDDYREGVGYDQIIYEGDMGKYIFTFSPADDEDMLTSIHLLNLEK
ncbi:MAG: hypothetical protein NC485_12775 [Ruminococcus flavefaciens]|nr:hypothetical protein [Ruminococcus flavefaciens]MCM1061372.1 hypothetical protein [Eubacterium sp.]